MNRLNSKLLLCAAALAATSVAGCADGHSSVQGSEVDDLALQAPPAPVTTTPDKNGYYFSKIELNGPGCPMGSWGVSISDDGLAFTVTFSKYDITLGAEEVRKQSTCQLGFDVHSPQGVSIGISSFFYSGYAFLQEGVKMDQSARYYWMGTGARVEGTSRSSLPKTGTTTYDDFWTFEDKVKLEDIVWSKCGVTRSLNVQTALALTNGQNGKKGTGQATLQAVDGNIALQIRFATKPCGDAGVGIFVPDAGPVRNTGK